MFLKSVYAIRLLIKEIDRPFKAPVWLLSIKAGSTVLSLDALLLMQFCNQNLMSISGQIVSEIVAQLCLENSIQTLLNFLGST